MMISTQIGRYQVLELLGQGGMGKVYRANDPHLGREVVLKIVTLPDVEWQQRFKREVQAAGRLNHPHIVTVYDVGLEHDPPYVVMELLAGGTLQDRLQAGPLPWRDALLLLRPLVQALEYAHRAGVIHRDIKPANIMFTDGDTLPIAAGGEHTQRSPTHQERLRGVLKLVDFGLARQKNQANLTEALTQAGMIFGTPGYMSPEQAQGEEVDARTDIFPLGLILFEAIIGSNPLWQGNRAATFLANVSTEPLDLSPLQTLTPSGLIALIARAVAKNRDERYSTCGELLTDLDRCLGYESVAAATPAIPSNRREPSLPNPTPPGSPSIQKAAGIQLTPEIETVLRSMFAGISRLKVEAEFGAGLSGGRVFRVRPYRGDKDELPAVVKAAPLDLISQERNAYQTWVDHKLPGVARLEQSPAPPPGSLWDGLRYSLAGGGAFEVHSLTTYYTQANPTDLRWLLEDRLYKMVGLHWWRESRLDRSFQMQADYDSLLPVNLMIEPLESASPNRRVISSDDLPWPPPKRDSIVELRGFIVTEIDQEGRRVTLNLRPADLLDAPSASYRLRLVGISRPEQFQVGQLIDSLIGRVISNRHDALMSQARRTLGQEIDLTTSSLPLSSASSPSLLPPPLPNPLLAYSEMLQRFLPANLSTIHGDLNLENILVDPATREIHLIDFATVRRGHTLHDLLRLETEVLTKLIPAALVEAHLPATTIHTVYCQLALAALHPDQSVIFDQLPPALLKPLSMLAAIRKMARNCLFNPEDWREYYQGLTLYLLGALKFKNLDTLPTAPLPKQVAFWGAASAVELMDWQPSPPPPPPSPVPSPKPLPWAKIVVAAMLVLCMGTTLVGALLWIFGPTSLREPASSLPPGETRANVIDIDPKVEIARANKPDTLVPASQGMQLFDGDRVIVDQSAAASLIIYCPEESQTIQLPENSNKTISCQIIDPSPGVDKLDKNTVKPPDSKKSGTKTRGAACAPAAAEAGQQPLLLTPRNTAIAELRPTFTWQPVAGASGYRLTIKLGNGKEWSRETTETSLPYPDPGDVFPLSPGSDEVIVQLATLDNGEVVDQTKLSIPTQAKLDELAQAEAEIEALSLDESARTYLLAQVYRQRGLWAAAMTHLEQLRQAETTPAPGLTQQQGDVYLEIGLCGLAETNYQTALDAAKTSQDIIAQAEALVGLARVANQTQTDPQQAINNLKEAEELYRQAGLTDQADWVKGEQDKLK